MMMMMMMTAINPHLTVASVRRMNTWSGVRHEDLWIISPPRQNGLLPVGGGKTKQNKGKWERKGKPWAHRQRLYMKSSCSPTELSSSLWTSCSSAWNEALAGNDRCHCILALRLRPHASTRPLFTAKHIRSVFQAFQADMSCLPLCLSVYVCVCV